jgi:hypothetical protein
MNRISPTPNLEPVLKLLQNQQQFEYARN